MLHNKNDVQALGLCLDVLNGKSLEESIEASERRGTQMQARTQTLPTEGLRRLYSPGAPYAALGIIIGDTDPNDALFTPVTLPDGWSIAPTAHSMWNEVLDDKGRPRIPYFYKASFHDTKATIHAPDRRYRVAYGEPTVCPTARTYLTRTYLVVDNTIAPLANGHYDPATALHCVTVDCAAIVAKTPGDNTAMWAACDVAEAEVSAWLTANYPDHANPLAYWD